MAESSIPKQWYAWDRFNQLLNHYPLGRPRIVHKFAQRNHNPEEPYALIVLVWVCGVSGRETSLFYLERSIAFQNVSGGPSSP